MSETSLIDAASTGDFEGVKNKLRQQSSEVDSRMLTRALNAAAFNGHSEIVKVLLRNGADINGRAENGNAPLNCAVETRHSELVEYLLENGADVNAQDESGMTALHQAVDTEAEYAKYLYDNGDVDACPTIQITDILIAAGADLNAKTRKGETPLRWAVNQGHKAAEELLRSHGAIE